MKGTPGISMPFRGAHFQGHPACPSQPLGQGEGHQGESNPTGEASLQCVAHPLETALEGLGNAEARGMCKEAR